MWRDVRVVDCGALEKLCPVKGTRGSNPRLSAKRNELERLWRSFFMKTILEKRIIKNIVETIIVRYKK